MGSLATLCAGGLRSSHRGGLRASIRTFEAVTGPTTGWPGRLGVLVSVIRVTVGHRAILHGCVVGDDCLIGMGVILLNGVRVGRGSVVGAGAALIEGTEVPPGSLCSGSRLGS